MTVGLGRLRRRASPLALRVAIGISRIAQSYFEVKNHRLMPPISFSRFSALLSGALLAVSALNAAENAPSTEAAPASGPKRAGGGPENPELKFRPPPPAVLSPAEEMKTFKVAPGFKVELVASEPMIETPISVSWDDQGRLFVCEMRGYMHDVDGTGEDQPLGRISRLEDTDGDGRMDRATVFADKLVMPRAVMALGDGALVAEPPNLTFYRDTDGDGVADKKEIVAQNYGTAGGQPEHMANSPAWMMDNWIWSSNHSARYRFQGGAFVPMPTQGFGQWGRTQDDWGRQYFNYNSDFLRCDVVPPEFYARNPRLADRTAINFQVMRDQTTWPAGPTPGVNRGYVEDTKKPDGTVVKGTLRSDGSLQSCTATCGAAIYRGDLFPPEYLGNAFIPEPSGNLVKRVILSENGALLTGKNAAEGTEFLTSTDERFRPVNACTGPDGALYIVDIARGVVQHKGFLTYYLVANIKDRKLEAPVNLGRIYRIVPDGAKPAIVKLPRETAQIVPLLAHSNGVVRDTAQRVLVERADASSAAAVKKIAATGPTPQSRAQALWTLDGMNALTPADLAPALHDADANVRAAAVRLTDPSLAPELSKLSRDSSPRVRLELAFKLNAVPGPEAEQTLIELLSNDDDPVFAEAVASGLAGRELEFLEVIAKSAGDKLEAGGIFQMLASCVIKERRAPRVAKLLALAAAQPDGPRQLALLDGIAGKSRPNNIKPIILAEAPPALAAFAANPKTKSLAERIDPLLVWAGKPGYVPAPKPAPLTPEEQALFDKGRTIYATLCGACHQPNGAGLAGLAPPLLDSDWALGPADRPIRIALQGLTGLIEVEGAKWQLEMPALPTLSDEDIAGVLTYIRREWGHGASAIQPGEVAKMRAAFASRSSAWTADELRKPIAPEQPKTR